MEFDTEKWNKYIQEQGGVKNVINKFLGNNLIKHCYGHNDYILDRLENDFNPIAYSSDTALFMSLDLDIENFIISESVQIVTGIETLRALCDGKILKHLRSDVFYKIENNLFVLKSIDNTWQKAYSYIDYILIDDFEVCNADSD